MCGEIRHEDQQILDPLVGSIAFARAMRRGCTRLNDASTGTSPGTSRQPRPGHLPPPRPRPGARRRGRSHRSRHRRTLCPQTARRERGPRLTLEIVDAVEAITPGQTAEDGPRPPGRRTGRPLCTNTSLSGPPPFAASAIQAAGHCTEVWRRQAARWSPHSVSMPPGRPAKAQERPAKSAGWRLARTLLPPMCRCKAGFRPGRRITEDQQMPEMPSGTAARATFNPDPWAASFIAHPGTPLKERENATTGCPSYRYNLTARNCNRCILRVG